MSFEDKKKDFYAPYAHELKDIKDMEKRNKELISDIQNTLDFLYFSYENNENCLILYKFIKAETLTAEEKIIFRFRNQNRQWFFFKVKAEIIDLLKKKDYTKLDSYKEFIQEQVYVENLDMDVEKIIQKKVAERILLSLFLENVIVEDLNLNDKELLTFFGLEKIVEKLNPFKDFKEFKFFIYTYFLDVRERRSINMIFTYIPNKSTHEKEMKLLPSNGNSKCVIS